MQINVRKGHSFGFFVILEADVLKVNGAVLDLVNRILWVVEGAFLVKHLCDTLARLGCHCKHYKHH